MDGVFKFFINAIKAIIFSPIYIIYFCFVLIIGLFNHVFGEFRILFSGFKYCTKQENKYTTALENKMKLINQGGNK